MSRLSVPRSDPATPAFILLALLLARSRARNSLRWRRSYLRFRRRGPLAKTLCFQNAVNRFKKKKKLQRIRNFDEKPKLWTKIPLLGVKKACLFCFPYYFTFCFAYFSIGSNGQEQLLLLLGLLCGDIDHVLDSVIPYGPNGPVQYRLSTKVTNAVTISKMLSYSWVFIYWKTGIKNQTINVNKYGSLWP